MNRPKFQNRVDRVCAELGMESPYRWPTRHEAREFAQGVLDRLPAEAQPYCHVDVIAARYLGRRRHEAYLRRTGGMLRNYADHALLMWECCGREERLHEVNYDRRGNLRPEDVAIVRALSYYHQCEP